MLSIMNSVSHIEGYCESIGIYEEKSRFDYHHKRDFWSYSVTIKFWE